MNYTNRPMSMYFKYEGKARPEIKSLSTFDAILAGERTGTTRFPDWYKYNPALYEQLKLIEPGTELRFMDTAKQLPSTRFVTVKAVPSKLSTTRGGAGSSYELTRQDMIDNPQWLERWSQREGWSANEGMKFFNKYGRGVQIPFEVVGDRPIATPLTRPIVLNTQPQVAPNPMNRQSFTQESLGRMASDVLEPRGQVLPQRVSANLGEQYLAMQETMKARQALESLALFANKYDVPI